MELAYQSASPCYFRMGKSDRGDVHTQIPKIEMGRLLNVKPGQSGDILFVATGSMLRTTLDVATQHYPNATVWSAPVIKPIDAEHLVALCGRSRAVVVVEEHSVMGGVGSLIAETITEFTPTRLLRIGVNDRFSHYCGTYDYLLHEHGLDKETIIEKINTFLSTVSS